MVSLSLSKIFIVLYSPVFLFVLLRWTKGRLMSQVGPHQISSRYSERRAI